MLPGLGDSLVEGLGVSQWTQKHMNIRILHKGYGYRPHVGGGGSIKSVHRRALIYYAPYRRPRFVYWILTITWSFGSQSFLQASVVLLRLSISTVSFSV